MSKYPCSLILVSLVFAAACGEEESSNTIDITDATDITNANFSSLEPSCGDHVGSYTSSVRDVARDVSFTGRVSISVEGGNCTMTSNSIPNHDFNDGAEAFVNSSAEVTKSFNLPASPSAAGSETALSLRYDDGIFLNGVKLDLLAAACYGVGNARPGEEKIGCFSGDQPFRYDPMSPLNTFGTDSHNAHTQPGGEYHYHGDPKAMYADSESGGASPVIGFAADGFPIFGPFFQDESGVVRRATSSYQLKSGLRAAQTFSGTSYDPSGAGGAFPGEEYNGRFRDDYAYEAGSGDLDACNGMTVNGNYGYYITNSFPWVIGCFKGALDDSFRK